MEQMFAEVSIAEARVGDVAVRATVAPKARKSVNRRIRYWLWKWFGIMRTNERPAFEHYLNNGRWPWE